MKRFLSAAVLFISLAFACMGDTPTVLIHVPLCRQAKDYTCGVASMQSVLRYYGVTDGIRQDQLEKALKTTHAAGTKYQNMVAYAEKLNFACEIKENMTVDDLKGILDQGLPVIILLQAWSKNNPPGYENDWKDGHYVVVVGYGHDAVSNEDRIYFMDPAILGTHAYLSEAELLTRWHESFGRKKLIHFGMIIKGVPAYNPDSMAHMD